MLRVFFGLICFSYLVACGDSSDMDETCKTLKNSLQTAFDSKLADSGSKGAAIAVITPSCGAWSFAVGNSTDSEPMRPDMVLRIGSNTKTVIAALVLELVEEGELTLDDTLDQFFPSFPNGSNITVRQLLNHSSGLFNYTDDETFQQIHAAEPRKMWAPQELVDRGTANAPYFQPGGGAKYSNTGFILAGMLIEQLTNESVGDEVRRRFLTPLELTSTSFEGEEDIIGTLAHSYTSTGADITTAYDSSWGWSAGAMVATAGDLARWALALYGGDVLSENSLTEMLTFIPTEISGLRYGLGAFEFSEALTIEKAWGHTGSVHGTHSQMLYLIDKKSVVVAIVNQDDAEPGTFTAAALNLILNEN